MRTPRLRTFLATVICACMMLSSITYAAPTEFIENLGQWDEKVLFKTTISDGSFFLEKNGFTYSLLDMKPFREGHENQIPLPDSIQGHAFKMKFLGANASVISKGQQKLVAYRNYYIGNIPSKWKSNVQSYKTVRYTEIYDGIDLHVYGKNQNLKYDLIVSPGSNASQIVMQYEGLDEMEILKNGDLLLSNKVVDLREKKPVAYQMVNGKKTIVTCNFKLSGKRVTFYFPNGYDRSNQLIIDPELVFASYSGSSSDNFGSSATYDNDGNLYGAGTAFGAGYPITVGAYSQPAGGNTDIGVSKFSFNGANLIYSTIIGGWASESIQSIVVNDNNELCILGASASPDYPVTANAYQPNFNGGPGVSWTNGYGYGIEFAGGCDIVLTKLSADGTTLAASTFIGGTHNDGINPNSTLNYNYGDPFRGEINVDPAGNIYVASSTESADFPTTSGSIQNTSGGERDAVVFKMNSGLSDLIWSTFLGGSQNDNAYSVQIKPGGELLVAGGTLSSNFPTTAGSLHPNQRGQADGWVAKLSNNGSVLLASTYVGTNQYDQVYFVQYDSNGDVFVLGQSVGNVPVSPSTVYSNPNSGQFIQKYDADLSNLLMSTTIGTGSGAIDFSPTAFLISNCDQIYLSGWGGPTNAANELATQSTTTGLPTTSDAFQVETDGKDFYLMMLEENAADLAYATFFGGTSGEHVDGGTSRFDKNGVVYQAVCAGCGGSNNFPTTPDAWSQANGSNNCNLGVFKFDLNQVLSLPELSIILGDCTYPLEVQFINSSSGANTFIWEYGDGTTSNVFAEPHYYENPGDYEVMLIAIDSLGCLNPDTEIVSFHVPFPPEITVAGSDTICSEEDVQLTVEGATIETFVWRPSSTVDDPSSTSPTATPTETTTYTVLATDSAGCPIEDEVTVFVSEPPALDAGADAYTEPGNPAQLLTSLPEGLTVLWSPPDGLSCTDCLDPIADPDETTTYYLEITDALGCTNVDSLVVYVYPTVYVPNAFTPGPNTANPVFYAYGQGIKEISLTIYNRWGQRVFQSFSLEDGWDGNFQGSPAPQDVYTWEIEFTTDIQPGRLQNRLGHVTLLRNMD